MNLIRILVIFVVAALPLRPEEAVFDEYLVKAAFLYNFAKFVEWPASTFGKANDPIIICIAGANPFGSTVEEMVRGKKIGERTIVVRRLAEAQQAGKCQILFTGAAEAKRTPALIETLSGSSILTVGETEDFTKRGGIIALRREGGRVRLQVALDTAEHGRLHISSKLLSLAEVVKRQP